MTVTQTAGTISGGLPRETLPSTDERAHDHDRLVAPPRHKLLFVDPSVAMTGAFRAAANSARALAGYADVILVLPDNSTVDATEFSAFAKVIKLPLKILRRSMKDVLLYLPALLSTSLALRSIVRREKITHVVLNDFYLMHGGVIRLLGYRGFIATWVRMNPASFPRLVSNAFLKIVWWSSDSVITVSRGMKALLPPTPKLISMYDPVGPAPASAGSPLPAARIPPVLIYVANYIRGKGHEHAIAAFAKVAASYPDAELHYWGGDMGMEKNRVFRDELKEQARATDFADRIIFHGFTTDPLAAFATARIALIFSETEALGYGTIEASQAGLPVIATRCGGPEEIVVDDVTGFLVPRGDVDAMADRMSTLLAKPELAARMGAAGAAFIAETFSAERFRVAFLQALGIPSDGERSAEPV